ncbi:MAG: pyruvate kinase [Thermodesulfobacteriota bacterium]
MDKENSPASCANPPDSKTKIVCTIGPASDSPEVIRQMILAGMNIARLNFSHGQFQEHGEVIRKIRAEARALNARVAILADMPGPKMRLRELAEEPQLLEQGDGFILTSDDILGTRQRVSTTFSQLPRVVKPGDMLFINDGLIQVKVVDVQGNDVLCNVVVGGELRSRKGLNLPGIDLGISAFTEHDHACMKFALENGVDCISQSFVTSAADIMAVRQAAADLGYQPFIVAKIERKSNRENIDEILEAADGIMVARGDLGVEIPIEDIAVAQKYIIAKANVLGKPVITATQMLESMRANKRPTRAEATDVANAILDGTDCVMLSEESAMGKYPVEAVAMLVRIAAATEPYRPPRHYHRILGYLREKERKNLVDLITLSVENTLEEIDCGTVIVPTASGATARNMARFRMHSWIFAVSPNEKTCQDLLFSYGVLPVSYKDHPENWTDFATHMAQAHGIKGRHIVVIEGPSPVHPQANHRMEIINIRAAGANK